MATTFIDPSALTPLFTAQQVTCGYPISDFYADVPRYLYYGLLIGCLLIRWHPWLSDVFLGAAATYAGVAAIEAFILLGNYPKRLPQEEINIPYISSASVHGNTTLEALPNLVTNYSKLPIQPGVLEFDIDAILAIVVTSYLFMLPVHCWSTHVRRNRARHLLMGLWNIMMLCATICALVMWIRLSDVPFQYRFCYPAYPDLPSITNDGWLSLLWRGNWNSTIWDTFADPAAANTLTENCIYPCFNTSQVLRRTQSIVATLNTNNSPRTDYFATDSQLSRLYRLAYFMYTAIAISAVTAIVVLVVTTMNMERFVVVPLHQPLLLWHDRAKIKSSISSDLHNLLRRSPNHTKPKSKPYSSDENTLPQTEKATTPTPTPRSTSTTLTPTPSHRRASALRLLANLAAFIILFIVVVVIPATWIVFVIWIEWWIHRDIVSSETPAQVGQWASAVSVGLILVSAWILRLKYVLASRAEVEREIEELKLRLRALEGLKEKKRR